jgi:myo-inositol-1(or 4)-monophosphatase
LIETYRQTAIAAAHAGGEVIREMMGREGQVHSKGYRDLVTDTDIAAQAVIADLIRGRHPQHKVLGEEDADRPAQWPPDGLAWMLDPVDGTTNYTVRLPVFCVSVGLLQDGQPLVGVIYDPLRDETFVAARGSGATLNGKTLRAPSGVPLSESLVGFDWARRPQSRARTVACVTQLAARCHTLRALGSAALAQVYVAAGRLQAYFHFELQPWDVAAATLIVHEAGGTLNRPDGADWHMHMGEAALLAAADAALRDEMVAGLAPALEGWPGGEG